jgi:hypothetical protein
VTSSPAGTPAVSAGLLGLPTTTVLLDQNNLQNDLHSGVRFTLGFWLPCYSDIGFEATCFGLASRGGRFSAQSEGDPILARPFVDANTGQEIAELVAFPGALKGSVTVDHSTRLWGVEANVRHKLFCGPCCHFDLLYGYRHAELDDTFNITENLVFLPGTENEQSIVVRDSFSTRNSFNGGQIGLEWEQRLWRRWFLNLHGKVALGDVHQVINIAGTTTTAFTNGSSPPTFSNVGVAALPSNIGRHTQDRFAVMPEFGLKFGIDICDHLRAWVGYDILWISDVVRAGEQIDRTINPNLLPTATGPRTGPQRPLVPFRQQTFWAQGLNLGLELRY